LIHYKRRHRPLRIGIDATGFHGPTTGIENYIICIIQGLLQIDKVNEYIIYWRNEIPQEVTHQTKNVRFEVVTFLNRKLFQQIRIPVLSIKDRLDVLLFPGNTLSLICFCPVVLTIHDLFPLVINAHMPKYHRNRVIGKLNGYYWKFINRAGCKIADRLISVSESTKHDLMKICLVPEKKISVIHEGVSEIYKRINDPKLIKDFKNKYGINYDYVLCVGTGPYKNLQGSLMSLYYLKRDGIRIKLIITGPKTRVRNDVFKLIKKLEIEEDVIFTGFFPQEDMVFLYNLAKVLLFPSYYEGFGVPILEAFACGTPVIAANVGSLPEVAGNAAILVDPYDPEEIAFHLKRILSDQNLRNRMVEKGQIQVKRFSWNEVAKTTLKVLEDVGYESENYNG
jgi:glycosyltransferase involved in cell wall biosynthesis